MENNHKKPFYKRIWFIVIAALIIIGASATLFVAKKTNSIIETNLRLAIEKNPNRLYLFEFKKIKINPLDGSLIIKELAIKPNPKALDSLHKLGIHHSLLSHVQVPSLKFKNVDIEKLIDSQTILLDEFVIENPNIRLDFTGYKKIIKDTVDPIEALYRIARNIQDLQVNTISINNANLLVSSRFEDNIDTVVVANGITLRVNDIKVDTSAAHVPIDLDEMKISLDSVWVHVSQVYDMSFNKIEASFKDSSISIGSFALTPSLTKENFSADLKYQKSWNDFKCNEVLISGIDIDDFLFRNKLQIKRVEVNDPHIYVYKDKAPKWPAHLKHTIPSALIKNIKQELNIELIELKNGTLHFEQKMAHRKSIGKLKMTNIFATVYNITNSSLEIEKSKWLTLDAQMELMGTGRMIANLKFDYTSPRNAWYLDANIGKMKMADLNPIIYPLTDAELLAGSLNDVDIKIAGSEMTAIGTLDMVYEKAKININMYNKETGKLEQKGFISFVANEVIRTSNVKGTASYKQGRISYTRTNDTPFIKFLWSSIQAGLIDTFIGIKDKTEREENKSKRRKRKEKRNSKKK